jgi:hypothetical protein
VWVQDLDAARGPVKTQLAAKDKKINELMEDLGNKELLLSEAQKQLSGVGSVGVGGVGWDGEMQWMHARTVRSHVGGVAAQKSLRTICTHAHAHPSHTPLPFSHRTGARSSRS